MVKKLYKSVALALIALLVNFVFANSVFVHTHLSAHGSPVTHSHPYLPGGHSHTQASLDQISSFNVAASAFQCDVLQPTGAIFDEISAIADVVVSPLAVGHIVATPLRGPPACRA